MARTDTRTRRRPPETDDEMFVAVQGLRALEANAATRGQARALARIRRPLEAAYAADAQMVCDVTPGCEMEVDHAGDCEDRDGNDLTLPEHVGGAA